MTEGKLPVTLDELRAMIRNGDIPAEAASSEAALRAWFAEHPIRVLRGGRGGGKTAQQAAVVTALSADGSVAVVRRPVLESLRDVNSKTKEDAMLDGYLTVRDLREILASLPDDLLVVVDGQDGGVGRVTPMCVDTTMVSHKRSPHVRMPVVRITRYGSPDLASTADWEAV